MSPKALNSNALSALRRGDTVGHEDHAFVVPVIVGILKNEP